MTVLPGGARVLHRLALAVEVLDALTSRPVTAPVTVHREGSRRQFLNRGGRFLLLFGPAVGDRADLRITDATRQVVPRRFRIPLWSLTDVEAADRVPPGLYIPALSRALRVWLSPGATGVSGPGFTVIRGRVVRGTEPVRWPRIAARGPGGVIVGRAHGDDRGEFVLPVTGLGTMPPPAPSQITVDLLVYARGPAGPPPPTPRQLALDPLADLPLEAVARSSSPPLPSDLDNALLRGASLPPFYVPSTAPVIPQDVDVGDLVLLQESLQFSP
ncbi:hypothetical protein AB0H18_19210 [Streptomyces sp. NPDC020766]|uniref:hypothetical protein n=1 Tax=Streptomyces sp. NPDC020766 TaxID=3155011 RepID=UPI0033DFA48D